MHERKEVFANMNFFAAMCPRTHVVLATAIPRWEVARARSAQATVDLKQCLLHSSKVLLDDQYDELGISSEGAKKFNTLLKVGMYVALARLQAPKFLNDITESAGWCTSAAMAM
ncbi:hypothetical protein DFH11DRAFT_1825858 [Phellopilus nigrolimitatus]|nr:hypothetical protein DFH11DRAFT_1825858 [Phellopilus nigrolimitatus]